MERRHLPVRRSTCEKIIVKFLRIFVFFRTFTNQWRSTTSRHSFEAKKEKKTIYKMNHKWNYRPITPEEEQASEQLAQELGISPILGRLLIQRGIKQQLKLKVFSSATV